MSYFSGRVHTVIFKNPNNNFYILRVGLDNAKHVRAVAVAGVVMGLDLKVGSWFGFEGKWDTHPKHGRQLVITRAPVFRDKWDANAVVSMLSGHGVSEQICLNLKGKFEDDLASVLDEADITKMSVETGLTAKTLEYVVGRWVFAKAYFKTLNFLDEAKVPKSKIAAIWSTFGSEAEDVLSKNPWRLVQISGITFAQADEVALRLGLDMDNPFRTAGAILYACKERRNQGHNYSTTSEIVGAVQTNVNGITPNKAAEALVSLHKDKSLVIDRSTQPGVVAVYEPWMLKLEQESAESLLERKLKADPSHTLTNTSDSVKTLVDRVSPYNQALTTMGQNASDAFIQNPKDLRCIAQAALVDWSLGSHITLTATQMEAAVNALVEPVSILTGLPGTGKTQTLIAVVSVLKDIGVTFLLLAPTGIAAKRMSFMTGAPAATIHRGFGAKGMDMDDTREATYVGVVDATDKGNTDTSKADGSAEFWDYDSKKPHPAKIVIVDEASMVDQHLLYRILSCTDSTCRLMFVGDAAQLPSVGAGNVLRDLVNAKLFPTVSLTEIFRQAETSGIVVAAHQIHQGRMPNSHKDFMFVEMGSEETIVESIKRIAQKLQEKGEDFQILSPRHAGILGVTNLNQVLRETLNPKGSGVSELRLGSETVREHDRVMAIKNNYKLGFYNGDVGEVVRINHRISELEVLIKGPPDVNLVLSFKDAVQYLRLAYAVTVHKCVHPDTLVETDRGVFPIKDISECGEVATPGNPQRYVNKISRAEGEALEIVTRGGYSVIVTPDHGMDVWDGSDYARTDAQDIEPGDILRLRMGVSIEPMCEPCLPAAPVVNSPSTIKHKLPSNMTLELAEFLGLMVADGTIYSRGFRLAKRHLDVADRFNDLCVTLFGVTPKRFFTLGAYHVEVNSVYLAEWLSSFGGLNPNAKAVPHCIFQTKSVFQARFLRGLFEDGTVGLKDGQLDHIEWSTCSETMVRVVRTLLLRFGIPCTTRKRRNYFLYVYGEYARLFGSQIGFISQFKQDRLALPSGRQTRYFVPVSRLEAVELRQQYRDTLGLSACNNIVQRLRVSLERLRQIQSIGGIPSYLEERARFHHEIIYSVNNVRCESMCVEVPEGHQFLQNGFCGWNSQGLEYSVVVMPWVRSFRHQLQRNLFYTAVTRAKKKVILLGQKEAINLAVSNNREDARNTLFLQRLLQGGRSSFREI